MIDVHILNNHKIKKLNKYSNHKFNFIIWDEKKIDKFKKSHKVKNELDLKLSILYYNGGLLIDNDFVITNFIDDIFVQDFLMVKKNYDEFSYDIIWAKNKKNIIIKELIDNNNIDKLLTSQFTMMPNSFYPSFSGKLRVSLENKGMLKKSNGIKSEILKTFGVNGYLLFLKIKQGLVNKITNDFNPIKQFVKKVLTLTKRSNKKMLVEVNNLISRNRGKEYVIFHNPKWLGITSATIELFENRIPCEELYTKSDIKSIGDNIIRNNIKQVVFSACCIGWMDLARYLKQKKSNIKIKVFWHGNHSQVTEPYGWARNIEIIKAHKEGIIDVFGTCKESIIKFYENEEYTTTLLNNTVNFDKSKCFNQDNRKKIMIGIYAAKSDDWRKNMFSEIAAVSFVKNAIIDMVPRSVEAVTFAKSLGLEVEGIDKPIPREELLIRMAKNDVNLYVTFSECAPMLPIESLEVGVPCLTGNNHHFFKKSKLNEYLVINEEDNPIFITEKIEECLKNRDNIIREYKTWKIKNDKFTKDTVNKFLNM